jgi:hypothetical protein
MSRLPLRGPGVRELGLRLPPARMQLLRGTRPLKRWRWVGIFSPELMVCVGDARVGPFRRSWWAIAEPDGTLRTRTTAGPGGVALGLGRVRVHAGGVRVELELEEAAGVEVVSPSGRHWIWTRKQADVRARGSVILGRDRRELDCRAVIDDSAGYHERHTAWRWSAGVGRGVSGQSVGWNLVAGIHDGPASERSVWIDGEPREVGPVEFADDLSRVDGLRFSEWCAREERTGRLLFRSRYRQPFGSFTGELPGGLELAEGLGVMEEHDVHW